MVTKFVVELLVLPTLTVTPYTSVNWLKNTRNSFEPFSFGQYANSWYVNASQTLSEMTFAITEKNSSQMGGFTLSIKFIQDSDSRITDSDYKSSRLVFTPLSCLI